MTNPLTGDWQLRLTRAEPGALPEVIPLRIEHGGDGYTAVLGDDHAEHLTRRQVSGLDLLEFHCRRAGRWEHYRLWVADAVLTGRFGLREQTTAPSAYPHFVTGWNRTAFEAATTPRVYDLIEEIQSESGTSRRRATLRLDRDETGNLLGRYKVYATQASGRAAFQCDEGLEHDVAVVGWDGRALEFVVEADPAAVQTYTGQVTGSAFLGTVAGPGAPPGRHTWRATRGGVLSFGFTSKPEAHRSAWQRRTRARLRHLIMAGDPRPHRWQVTTLQAGVAPGGGAVPRDDDPARHPPAYRLSELTLAFELVDRQGRALERRCHGWLAVPEALSAGGRAPAMLVLNGHLGSAISAFYPGIDGTKPLYWYGDAFARRGYVVLALDVSHRPPADRRGQYAGYDDGDDPRHGNPARPAIRGPADPHSEWEEPGERAWDVSSALDYLLTLPQVDAGRVGVGGLSMGGEVATLAGALDERFALVIAAGYSPDLAVMQWHGNHGCWQWLAADMREYLDVSDLQALIAPRGLIVQTSKQDATFSDLATPFAADLQVARRTRAAYGSQASQFVHYLHELRLYPHEFCVGDVNPEKPDSVIGVEVPRAPEPAPGASHPSGWQTDGAVHVPALGDNPRPTLFDYLDELLRTPSRAAEPGDDAHPGGRP